MEGLPLRRGTAQDFFLEGSQGGDEEDDAEVRVLADELVGAQDGLEHGLAKGTCPGAIQGGADGRGAQDEIEIARVVEGSTGVHIPRLPRRRLEDASELGEGSWRQVHGVLA